MCLGVASGKVAWTPQDSRRVKKPRDCSLSSIQEDADFWGPLFLQIGFITFAGPAPRLGVQPCVRVGGVVSVARLLQSRALPTKFQSPGQVFHCSAPQRAQSLLRQALGRISGVNDEKLSPGLLPHVVSSQQTSTVILIAWSRDWHAVSTQ